MGFKQDVHPTSESRIHPGKGEEPWVCGREYWGQTVEVKSEGDGPFKIKGVREFEL